MTELAGCGVAVTSQNARAFVEYISDIENLNYDVTQNGKASDASGTFRMKAFPPSWTV